MSLAIRKFSARVHLPPSAAMNGAPPGNLARDRLASDCARYLGPRWPSAPGVICIRRLPLKISLSERELSFAPLSEILVAALGQAIFTVISGIAPPKPLEIVRFENAAAMRASFLTDLLRETARGRWEYHEFEPLLALDTAEAVLQTLLDEPSQTAAVLRRLASEGALDRLIAVLDDLAIERIFVALSRSATIGRALSVADLIEVSRLALSLCRPGTAGGLDSRGNALRIFARETGSAGQNLSARQIFLALKALRLLFESASPANRARALDSAPALAGEAVNRGLHPELSAVLRAALAPGCPEAPELARTLAALCPVLAPAPARETVRTVRSDCAGLFLLAHSLNRCGWETLIERSIPGARCGPQATTYVLAALALAILGRFLDEPRELPEAVALFAGWSGAPDLHGMRKFLASTGTGERAELVAALAGGGAPAQSAERWSDALDFLADRLLRDFAAAIRGFRKASRRFITRNLIAIPGRIVAGGDRLRVCLEPSPFHIALHISGMDESTTWLGGKTLEFVLEGL